MTNSYLLDQKAQEHLKNGVNTLWQAHSIIEMIQKAYSDNEHAELYSALSGVLALMNSGLDDLGEV